MRCAQFAKGIVSFVVRFQLGAEVEAGGEDGLLQGAGLQDVGAMLVWDAANLAGGHRTIVRRVRLAVCQTFRRTP